MYRDPYEIQLAEENAVASVQAMVIRLLDAKQITRTALAERMGVSAAHVSQILGDNPQNLSVKKAARVFHALGEELVFSCAGIEELDLKANQRHSLLESALRPSVSQWECANGNEFEGREVGELQAAA